MHVRPTAPDLVAFVTARLDEREALARAAIQPTAKPVPVRGVWVAGPGGYVEADDFELYDDGTFTSQHAEHIAANDPAHVLREVEAMRAIVERYTVAVWNADHEKNYPEVRRDFKVAVPFLRDSVADLAAIWSEHVDWREEWRP